MPVPDAKELLKKTPLFSGLADQDLAALSEIVGNRSSTRGEVLFYQGDPGDEFLVLTEGSVKVELMNPDGKELTLTILTPYQFLGELALLDDVPRSATVVAMEKTEFLTITKKDFSRVIETYPRMCIPMMRQLTKRVRVLTDDIASMAFMDSYSRVTRKILALATDMGESQEDGSVYIPQALTHQQLANLVGTTRETVTKILNEMKDRNLISIRRHRITIHDREGLVDRANLAGFI